MYIYIYTYSTFDSFKDEARLLLLCDGLLHAAHFSVHLCHVTAVVKPVHIFMAANLNVLM